MFAPMGLFWAIVTLIAGILIIILPGLLRWLVGIYLVIIALVALFQYFF